MHLSRTLSPAVPVNPSFFDVRGGPFPTGVAGVLIPAFDPEAMVVLIAVGLGVAAVGVLAVDLPPPGFCLSTVVFHFFTSSFAALATLIDSCWRSLPTARPALLS